MQHKRVLLRLALTVIAAATSGLAVAPAGAQASSGNTAILRRMPTSPMPNGHLLEISVRYGSNAPTTQWRLEFDLDATTFPDPWSGYAFSRSGNRWALNYAQAAPQRANTTLVIQLTMFGLGHAGNCGIDGTAACTYVTENDQIPPTAPTNLTATRYTNWGAWGPFATVYLTWGASTDNLRLAGYQLLANGQVVDHLSAGVTAVHTTYTTAQVTYSLRAYDSVANFSPSATVTLPAL